MLDKGHHDVKLSDEDFHRLALWLDCCSMFYGVFEKEAARRNCAAASPNPLWNERGPPASQPSNGSSRRVVLRILPVALRGRAGSTTIFRGTL